MKAKEYLRQIELLDEKIYQKYQEYNMMRSMLNTKSIDYSKERVQISPEDSMSKIVSRYLDLQNEINADIDYLVNVRNQIINQIQGLNDIRYVKLLYKKYVEYKSLEMISVEMGYSYDRIRHLHGLALLAFGKEHSQIKN